MECLSASILVVLGVLGFAFAYRRMADTVQPLQERIEGLVSRIAVLEHHLAEVERRIGIAAPPLQPPEPVRAPPPEPVRVEAPAAPVPMEAPVAAEPSVGAPPVPEIPAPPPEPTPVHPPPFQASPAPARPAPSLEERLGVRLAVWIAAIAIALAGAFFVKHSFDRGWLSPTVRVALGVLFGLGLLAVAEVMRRWSERISQGLSAAGIADLFACFLAGVHLYGLIPPGLGFALMALTTVVAVVLSLRQGIMVALIGLIGGFLTPYLMRTEDPSPRGLFAYLLLLQIGLLAVSWKRAWTGIAALALGGGLLWVFLWLAEPFQPEDAPWLALFLLLSAASVVAAGLARRPREEAPEEGAAAGPGMLGLAWLAVPGALVAMALVTGRTGFSTQEWLYFGLLAAGALVLARLRPDFQGLAWVALGAALVLLGAWGWDVPEAEAVRLLATALGLGLLFAGGGYAALFGSPSAGQWASLSAVSGLAFFLLAWASVADEVEMRWGPWALAIAALYLAAAIPVARQRQRPEMSSALAALAVAVTTFASLAVPLELERQWLTVAWALEVTALVWLAGRFRLPVLSALARVVAVGVAVRLLLNASVIEYPIGDHALFNWLLYGYGIPLLAFAAAAVLARRQGPGEEQFATLLELGALAFAFALVTLEVRQVYHPGDLASAEVGFAEWGTLISAWLGLGLGVLMANRQRLLPSLELGGRALLGLGAVAALFGPGVIDNPLWTHEAVGETLLFNLLLWSFGLPAVLLGFGAAELQRRGNSRQASSLARVTLVLAFVLLSLEVRQAFHGSYLDTGIATAAERYAYSAAWILFGTALLALGVLRRVKSLRYASLVVMLIAVAKVFLYDAGQLSDLYRVLSFLGLGVSLLVLAWVYQRFVFRENA